MTVGLPLAGPATTVQASRFLRPSQAEQRQLARELVGACVVERLQERAHLLREVLRLRVEIAERGVEARLGLLGALGEDRSEPFGGVPGGAIVRIGRQRLRVRGPRRRGVALVLGVEARRIRRPGLERLGGVRAQLAPLGRRQLHLEGRDQQVGDVLLEREELVLLALDPLARQHGARLDVEDARVDPDRVAHQRVAAAEDELGRQPLAEALGGLRVDELRTRELQLGEDLVQLLALDDPQAPAAGRDR